jgi:hypothetical protein
MAEAWARALQAAKPAATPCVVEGLLARQEVPLPVVPPKTGRSWLLEALTLDGALGRPVFGSLPVEGPLWILRERADASGVAKVKARHREHAARAWAALVTAA